MTRHPSLQAPFRPNQFDFQKRLLLGENNSGLFAAEATATNVFRTTPLSFHGVPANLPHKQLTFCPADNLGPGGLDRDETFRLGGLPGCVCQQGGSESGAVARTFDQSIA